MGLTGASGFVPRPCRGFLSPRVETVAFSLAEAFQNVKQRVSIAANSLSAPVFVRFVDDQIKTLLLIGIAAGFILAKAQVLRSK